MSTADDLAIGQSAREPDRCPPEVDRGSRLTTWYAQGYADGLGDRLLMFDNTGGPSWEVLRFTPALARHGTFEAAVRQRVDQLRSFQHPAFPLVRPVGDLGDGSGLAVVSTHVPGVSLSEVVKKPRTTELAVLVADRLLTALAALHEHAAGIAHGALTTERVVLTTDLRPVVREHMLGSALASLELSTEQLWAAFGILTSPERQDAPFGAANDVVQVALLAVSLLAGRRIGPRDFPDGTSTLLDAVSQLHAARDGPAFESFRGWLDRALAVNGPPFESARSAREALAMVQGLRHPSEHAAGVAGPASEPAPAAHRTTPGVAVAAASVPPSIEDGSSAVASLPRRKRRRSHRRIVVWVAAAAGAIALGEAAFIGTLLRSAPAMQGGGTPSGEGASLEEPPPELQAAVTARRSSAAPSLTDIVAPAVDRAAGAVPLPEYMSLQAAPLPRRGGLTVSSPVALHVLNGDRLIGSSDEGPIIAAAGRHELEFVNSLVGFRTRRIVDVAAGRVSAVSIAVPNGTLNINAIPWAEVWVDGVPFGETPLGNVSLVPGEHEILFRHPEFGERREKAIVRPETLGRVAVSMRQ